MVDYRNVVSIIQLVAYVPAFFVATFVAFRHGFGRSSGWIFLVMFSLIRTVGPVTSLLTLTYHSIGIYITAAICDSIGLSPLLMSSIGLLTRVNDSIARKARNELNPIFFRLVNLLTLVGLILFIVGETSNISPEGMTQIRSETKIGEDLFITAFVLLCVLLLVLGTRRHQVEDGEHRLLGAVAISMPLLLVRLIYSGLLIYVNDTTFNFLTGNVTALLFMSALTEIIIVGIYLGTGLTLHEHLSDVRYEESGDLSAPLQQQQNSLLAFDNHSVPNTAYDQEDSSLEWKRSHGRRRRGPIGILIGMVVSATRSSGQR